MASSGQKLSGRDAKINRLDTVFKKAIDVASNSLSNADLDDCFQDLKSQYGNVLPKLFVNMIAKTQVNIEASYKDICILRDLEEGMQSFEVPSISSSSSSALPDEIEVTDAENPLSNKTLITLKRVESEHLREAIQNLDSKIERMTEQAKRLRTSLLNEVMAVTEVENRMSS